MAQVTRVGVLTIPPKEVEEAIRKSLDQVLPSVPVLRDILLNRLRERNPMLYRWLAGKRGSLDAWAAKTARVVVDRAANMVREMDPPVNPGEVPMAILQCEEILLDTILPPSTREREAEILRMKVRETRMSAGMS